MTEHADFAAIPEVTLGWRIRLALDKGNLKQEDLMREFEVSRDTASRWCRDVGAPPKRYVLQWIAQTCGVPLSWLENGGPTPTPPRPPPGTALRRSGAGRVVSLHSAADPREMSSQLVEVSDDDAPSYLWLVGDEGDGDRAPHLKPRRLNDGSGDPSGDADQPVEPPDGVEPSTYSLRVNRSQQTILIQKAA